MKRVWLLNLDADAELARGLHYQPSKDALKQIDRFAGLLGKLIGDDPSMTAEQKLASVDNSYRDHCAMMWCPTPSAIRRANRVGAHVPPSPNSSVLACANSRAFAASVHQHFDDGVFCSTIERATMLVASAPGTMLAKRAFSTSGRGQRRLQGSLSAHDRTWLAASFGAGVQIEPLVTISKEVALPGFISVNGDVALGSPVIQQCSPHGSWQRSAVSTSADSVPDSLTEKASLVAERLLAIGYHGPFGIDAYWYVRDGKTRFNPLSEINARYTMGWAHGWDATRPDLAALR